jgi:hypothetical protein
LSSNSYWYGDKIGFGMSSIIGTARATENISCADIWVKFYYKDKNLIRSGFDKVLDLVAVETCSFKVTCHLPENSI